MWWLSLCSFHTSKPRGALSHFFLLSHLHSILMLIVHSAQWSVVRIEVVNLHQAPKILALLEKRKGKYNLPSCRHHCVVVSYFPPITKMSSVLSSSKERMDEEIVVIWDGKRNPTTKDAISLLSPQAMDKTVVIVLFPQTMGHLHAFETVIDLRVGMGLDFLHSLQNIRSYCKT